MEVTAGEEDSASYAVEEGKLGYLVDGRLKLQRCRLRRRV